MQSAGRSARRTDASEVEEEEGADETSTRPVDASKSSHDSSVDLGAATYDIEKEWTNEHNISLSRQTESAFMFSQAYTDQAADVRRVLPATLQRAAKYHRGEREPTQSVIHTQRGNRAVAGVERTETRQLRTTMTMKAMWA